MAFRNGVDVERIEEGMKVRDMIMRMPKLVEKDSKWYVLDMAWVKQWQEYIYFDLILGLTDQVTKKETEMPESLDWSDITKPTSKKSTLQDTHKEYRWQNVELKENLREGDDFFLVTPEIFTLASKVYGMIGHPVERYGIAQADGETCVELYLKKLLVLPVPTTQFSINSPKHVLVSRNASTKDLKAKILRVMNMQLYQAGNKTLTYRDCRLWVHPNDDSIMGLEKRQKNFTTIEINAKRIDQDLDEIVDNLEVANDDVVVVEF